MIEIRLTEGNWYFDPNQQLGTSGGFGSVFLGEDVEKAPIAIKKLHLRASDAAHRELRMAESLKNRTLKHVLPVLDAGQDAESSGYFIVMPVADHSLQDILNQQKVLPLQESLEIVKAVLEGLAEVSDITHRDLKPGNILYHDNRWKVADFGISRFVEDSTSINTLKGAMTLIYAAPEQLRLERSTSATDVYALGCIAYQLLTGNVPFSGSWEELNEAHQHHVPPSFPSDMLPNIQALISMMLRKAPGSRPSINRIREQLTVILTQLDKTPSPSQLALARASAGIAADDAQIEATEAAIHTKIRERKSILRSGFQILDEIIGRLSDEIAEQAPNSNIQSRRGDILLVVELGQAYLEFGKLSISQPIEPNAFPNAKQDIIGAAYIQVRQEGNSYSNEYEIGFNLWYRNWGQEGEYRWVEVAYMAHPLTRSRPLHEPFYVTSIRDADIAASNVVGGIQHASRPNPIDDECLDGFLERWLTRFAKAARGELSLPRSLPLDGV